MVGAGDGGMVSVVTDARPGQAPAKRLRPGSGVPVDPKKLTWIRNDRQLTREQLSDRIRDVARERGILNPAGEPVTYSLDAVAKLENRERKPKMHTFEALCAALDCDPADLLEDFPGTQRSPMPSRVPPADEVARILGDCADSVDTLLGKLSTRAWNSVRNRSGCTTIGQLALASSDGTLEDIYNLGFVQLAEIRRALALMALDREPDAGETDPGIALGTDADADADAAEAG